MTQQVVTPAHIVFSPTTLLVFQWNKNGAGCHHSGPKLFGRRRCSLLDSPRAFKSGHKHPLQAFERCWCRWCRWLTNPGKRAVYAYALGPQYVIFFGYHPVSPSRPERSSFSSFDAEGPTVFPEGSAYVLGISRYHSTRICG